MSDPPSSNEEKRRLPEPDDWIAGRFKIVRVVGKGGFGTVYEAQQESMGDRRVALKVLAPKRQAEHNAVERFRQEALLASRLHHPNTITLFDFGATPEGLFYIAMEYLEGDALGSIVKRNGPVQPRRAEHIVRQVLGSLSEAHSIGLIHRDLKPDNVFLTRIYGEPDFVKVLDFGLAKMSDVLDESKGGIVDLPSGGRTDLTMEGLVCGTPDYMAPEQAQGVGLLTPAADVYGVGLLIYQMLSGRKPFRGKTPMDILKQQVHAQLPQLPAHVTEHRLAKLMRIATRKRSNERYPDATAMLQALSGQIPMDPMARPLRSKAEADLTKTRAHGMSALLRPTPKETADLDDDILGLNLDADTSPGLAALELAPLLEPNRPQNADTTGTMSVVDLADSYGEVNQSTNTSIKPPGLLTGTTPLLGREQEVRQILASVRGSTAAEQPNKILLLEGDAGVGKSRLLNEIGRIVRETSDIFVAGGHFQAPGASASEALASLTGQIFSIEPEIAVRLARQDTLLTTIKTKLDALGLPLSERDITLISSLLVPAADTTEHPALTLERMVRMLVRMAKHQQLLLFFEDMQFADPTSLDFLRRFSSSVARLSSEKNSIGPICLVLTLRRQSIPHREGITRILSFLATLPPEVAPTLHIEGLSESASLQMVDALLPADVELRRRAAEAAHGNPLHMVQILQHLVHTKRLTEVDGRWKLIDNSVPLSLPEDLMEMVRLRVKHALEESSAPQAMQELLYRLAVLGRRVPHLLLRTSLDLEERPWPPELTARLLGELQGHHLIIVDEARRDERVDPSSALHAAVTWIRFENGMLPELLQREVDSSLAGTRLHQTAARAKQSFYGAESPAHAGELASHLIRAGMPDKALPYLLEAGHQRQRLGDLLGARSHYIDAESLLSDYQDSAPSDVADLAPRLWLSMGQVHLRLGRFSPAEHDLKRALSLAKLRSDQQTMARASLHLGELFLVQKNHRSAASALEHAWTYAQEADDRASLLKVRIAQGKLDLDKAEALPEDQMSKFESYLETLAEEMPLLNARGLQHLGFLALSQGDNHAAERYLARARLIADEVGDPGIQGPICSDLGHVLLLQGRGAEGEGLLRQALQIYREIGDQLALSTCLHRLALPAWQRRDLDEAMNLISEALDIQRQLPAIGHISNSLSLMGKVQEARGDLQKAQQSYLEALNLPLQHKDEVVGDLLLRLGSTNLKLGKIDAARRELEQAGQRFASMNDLPMQVQSLNLLAMAASWRGESMQANALLERSEDLATRCEDNAGRIFALAALALLSFISPIGESKLAIDRMDKARSLAEGASPLLASVSSIMDGHGPEAISSELPQLQRRWLKQLIAP